MTNKLEELIVELYLSGQSKPTSKKMFVEKEFGNGSLTCRYILRDDEGNKYFVKTYLNNNSCQGTASREILLNEMAVQDKLAGDGNSFYKGFAEINDTLCLFFKDMTKNSGMTLATVLDVEDPNFETKNESLFKTKIEAKGYTNFKLENIVDITLQIATNLKQLHEKQGLIHADLSPDNIIIVDGKVIVNDYGIARPLGGEMKLLYNKALIRDVGGSYYGSAKGILYNIVYSPPDVEKMEFAEANYDTYLMTNLLCLMTTGKLVEYWNEEMKTDPTALKKQLKQEFSKKNRSVNPYNTKTINSLCNIILKGTDEDKEKRFSSVKDFSDAIAGLNIGKVVDSSFVYHSGKYTIPDAVSQFKPTAPLAEEYFEGLWQGALDGYKPIIEREVEGAVIPSKSVGLQEIISKAQRDCAERPSFFKKKRDYFASNKLVRNIILGVGLAGALAIGYGVYSYISDNNKSSIEQKVKDEPKKIEQNKLGQNKIGSNIKESQPLVYVNSETDAGSTDVLLEKVLSTDAVSNEDVNNEDVTKLIGSGEDVKQIGSVDVVASVNPLVSIKNSYLQDKLKLLIPTKKAVAPVVGYKPVLVEVPVAVQVVAPVIPKLKLVIEEENKKYVYGDIFQVRYSLFKDGVIVSKPNCSVGLEGLNTLLFSKDESSRNENKFEGRILQNAEDRARYNKGILTITCKEGLAKIEKEVDINFEPKLELIVQDDQKGFHHGDKVNISYYLMKNGNVVDNSNCYIKTDPLLRLGSFSISKESIKGVIPFFISKNADSRNMEAEKRSLTLRCEEGSWSEEKKINIDVESTIQYSNVLKFVTKPILYNPIHKILASADICEGCNFTVYETTDCNLRADTKDFKLSSLGGGHYQLDRKEKLTPGEYNLDLLCSKDFYHYGYNLPLRIKSSRVYGSDEIKQIDGESKLKSGEYCTNCDLKTSSMYEMKCEMEKNDDGFYLQKIRQVSKRISDDSDIRYNEALWRINRDRITKERTPLIMDNLKVNCGDLGSRQVRFYLMKAPPIQNK